MLKQFYCARTVLLFAFGQSSPGPNANHTLHKQLKSGATGDPTFDLQIYSGPL